MRRSRAELFGIDEPVDLAEMITIPRNIRPARHKCRIAYGLEFGEPEFTRYLPRGINSLKIIAAEHIDYRLKRADRSDLEQLRSRRGRCDEIIVTIEGFLTDTSFSNIALFDGDRWYTPKTPLLEGIMRQKLISRGTLTVRRIGIRDLGSFDRVSLINAMLDLDQTSVAIEAIDTSDFDS